MAVRIRTMTNTEYEIFFQWSIAQHTNELMEECGMSPEEAIKEAKEELSQMLPYGLNTKHNYLMTILETDLDETAGFIWILHEETEGRKQSFICDFAIWEAKRRKGYASAALHLVEQEAVKSGCQESVLFVADSNDAAKALYKNCGYHVLRQEQYGNYMLKQLSRTIML